VIRAMIHKWVTRNSDGHRVWSDDMIWSGESARVWFCTCGEEFWPITKEGPYSDWRDNPVKREPPD
jgi:hypothetical protein